MLNLKEFVEGPKRPELRPPTDTQVSEYFREKIEEVAGRAAQPIRIAKESTRRLLLDIRGGCEYSTIFVLGTSGRVDNEGLQQLAFATMQEYGLNPDIHEVDRVGWPSPGIFRDHLIFPSTTIPGLVFDRFLYHYPKTGETYRVTWEVRDAAPAFKVFDVTKRLRQAFNLLDVPGAP